MILLAIISVLLTDCLGYFLFVLKMGNLTKETSLLQ
jgi:hypothetical protein